MALTQTIDSPTTNYAVMTSIYPDSGTASNGNLTMATAGNDGDQPIGSIAFDSQDSDGYYFIMRPTTTSSTIGAFAVGVATVDHANHKPRNDATNAGSWFLSCGSGGITNTSGISNGTWDSQSNGGGSLNDYFQIAVKAGKIYFGKNNTWYDSSDGSFGNAGEAFSNLTGFVVPMFQHAHASAGTVQVEFGALGYTHAKPSGLKDINAANLFASNTPAIEDGSAYHQTTLYTGNGGSLSITQDGTTGQQTENIAKNSKFQPDFIWGKQRDGAQEPTIFDVVRGTTKYIQTNSTAGDATQSGVTAFNGDGFDLGSWAVMNENTKKHVAWQWLAGGAPTADNTAGAGATPTAGSVKIDGSNLGSALAGSLPAKRLSANTKAGFSIVKWTGNGGDGGAQTVAHGLGQKPNMIFVKNLDDSENWVVYHDDVGFNALPINTSLRRITTGASVYWNDAQHNETIFNVNTHNGVNGENDEMIAYCFTAIPGYSAIGKYVGNGSSTNGPFVNTGFSPSWILARAYDDTSDAAEGPVHDSMRDPLNPMDLEISINRNGAEDNNQGAPQGDFLSNGFKIGYGVGTTGGGMNIDGVNYIYLAFAEHPFAGTTPVTAR